MRAARRMRILIKNIVHANFELGSASFHRVESTRRRQETGGEMSQAGVDSCLLGRAWEKIQAPLIRSGLPGPERAQ